MNTLELGIIGNGTVAALVDPNASMQWLCLPRFDGEPVFNALVGGNGAFSVALANQVSSEQTYVRNTAIIETVLTADDGSSIKITDFAPRFFDRGRVFRPASVVRRITPLTGMPRITVFLRAESKRGERTILRRRGVSHIRFPDEDYDFRVTTDAPVSWLALLMAA